LALSLTGKADEMVYRLGLDKLNENDTTWQKPRATVQDIKARSKYRTLFRVTKHLLQIKEEVQYI